MAGVHRCMQLPQPVNSKGNEIPVVLDDYLKAWEEEKDFDKLLLVQEEEHQASTTNDVIDE